MSGGLAPLQLCASRNTHYLEFCALGRACSHCWKAGTADPPTAQALRWGNGLSAADHDEEACP